MRVFFVAALVLASGLLFASTVEARDCRSMELPPDPNAPDETLKDVASCEAAVRQCMQTADADCLARQLPV